MWRPKDPLKLIPLNNGYFIVSFSNKEDRAYAFQEGPWMIDDHYLTVQRWRPNFNPWKVDVQCNIAAWIRLPDVPFEFYNVESLRRIGNMIGKMIKVDRSTSIYDKGGFARICVEIDLKKPLIPTYLVFGEERPIIYEGLHQVCLMCGKYGHQKEGCPLNVCKATNQVSEQEKVEEVPVGDSSSKPKKDVNGKEGVEEGISSVSGVVGGNGGKSPEKDSISGGEPSTVSDGGQKIDESPFGKIKLLRRDFRGNLSGHLSEASVKKGIQEKPVLAEFKGSIDGIRILRREQIKKEVTPSLNENKKASTRDKAPQSAEWVQVGSKRKGESKGKLKGKENKSKPKTRPSRESTGMEAKEVVDVSPIPKATVGNDAGPSLRMNEDVLIPPGEALSVKDVVLGYSVGDAEFQGAKSFPALVRDLKSHDHLDFIAIMETRCAKESSVVRASQLGFSNMELIDCEGYSGGIWCLWNPSIASISVLERHHQFIHLQVNGTTGHSWTLTVVYASPSCISRRVLWDNLSRLAQSMGGYAHDLRDMGFAGPEFTWKRGMSEARLDRILVNNQWYDQFSNASVSHLPFFKSDHRPLLLQLDSTKDSIRSNRPFRFIAAWALHENFDDFVRQSWLTDAAWLSNISQFSEACSKWNKEVFRHTVGRKKHLLRRLDGLNKAVSLHGLLPKYEELQITIWKELEDVLLQESLIWAQKSRADWSVSGDRNTRYFHGRANRRRKSQRIEAIKDGEGSWIYDPLLIKENREMIRKGRSPSKKAQKRNRRAEIFLLLSPVSDVRISEDSIGERTDCFARNQNRRQKELFDYISPMEVKIFKFL
ncbi:hypothetical protein K1719_017283 [Acacia pycnantha]|nr:hypothetical protein K1719_017283 [Acacia pycnantha]